MILYANRYESIGILGSGSYGRVLRVRDTKTDMIRALKLIVQNSKSAAQTLKNEFSILQNFTHPNLANVLEIGQITENDHSQWFLVSELIEGPDLFTWSKSATQSHIDKIFLQLLQTLHFLHEHNICHGDLKPQNILVANQNGTLQLKLIDFGLAQKMKATNHITGGTAAYMAPEMTHGAPTSPQTDIYAAGVVFYKILTHNLPDSMQDFVAPTVWNPNVPAHYNVILEKMLCQQSSQRYQSVQNILEDLLLLKDESENLSDDQTKPNIISFEPFFLRLGEKKKFLQHYHERLFSTEQKLSPIVLVFGAEGVGKSYFLEDIRKMAKQDMITTLSWEEWQKQNSFEDLPEQAIVLGDNVELDYETINYLNTFFDESRILFVFSASQLPKDEFLANQIQLNNWSFDDTTLFLQTVIGQTILPQGFVETIFDKTKGSPFALQQCIQTLLQKNLLRTESGKWSEKILHDLQNQLILEVSNLTLTESTPSPVIDLAELQTLLNLEASEVTPEDQFLYAKFKRRDNQPHKALEILAFILQNESLKFSLRVKVVLECAEINIELNRLAKAESELRSISTHRELSADNKIRTLELLGVCAFRNQNLAEACQIFNDALTLLQTLETPNAVLSMSIQSRLSLVKLRMGDRENAEALSDAAWKIFQTELSLSEKLATVRLNIDEIYYQKGLYGKALDCLNEYYQILAAEPFREAYPITLYKMARVHLQMQDWALAEFKLNLCLQEFKKRNSLQWLSYVYNESGILAKKKNLWDEALQNYQHAFELQRLFKKDESLFLIALNLGNLHLEKQNFAEAEKYFSYAHKNLLILPTSALVQKGLLGCALGLASTEIHAENFNNAQTWLKLAFNQLQKDFKNSAWQIYWQHQVVLAQATHNIGAVQKALMQLRDLSRHKNFDQAGFLEWQARHFDKNPLF